MAAPVLRKGQTVETNDGKQGVIQYIGPLEVSPGDWCGLELPDASGKNDGSVKGVRYFDCEPGHGIFVRRENVAKVVKQLMAAPPVVRSNGQPVGAAAVKSRPSSIMAAETARKRQSLMSNSSGSQPGSRLSTRSPTKSPSKGARSSVSSTASTPRTGTPATTARTSDSSAKSRLSIAGKPLAMQPPAKKPTATTPRVSLAGSAAAARTDNSTLGPARGGTATSRLSLAARSPSRPIAMLTQSPVPSEDLSHEIIQESLDETLKPEAPSDIPAEDTQQPPPIDDEQPAQEEQPTVNTPVKTSTPTHSPAMKPRPRASLAAADTRSTRAASISRTNALSQNAVKATNQREIEELKVKIRTLEKKRQDDRDELKQIETLRSEKDRYAKVAETLQKKLKANQEEIKLLKARCEEAEEKANTEPQVLPGEIESMLELANMNREEAEALADNLQSELDLLKLQNDELTTELDVLRLENTELSSTIDPEERSSLGWMQMEKENDRLREALIVLRDHAKETESNSSSRIKELERDLENAENSASKWLETSAEAKRLKDTNAHLLEQLEAAESQEEVVADMMQERDRHLAQIEALRSTLSELEELAQTNQDLESFYVENERGLLSKLDEQDALLNERERQSSGQDQVIEDLEYTLNKFREVVSGLQSDINEARRSREISELQAHEMTNKSKAMMDLNLRLQNSASKSQTKLIDVELIRIQAAIASKQTEILSLYLPESFDSERNAVLAYLAFTKIKSRAGLIASMLSDRLRERSHLTSGEETISGFEVVDVLHWIEATADRFERFMDSCSPTEFAAFGSVPIELDPVDRALAGWVDALRRDELGPDGPEHLRRLRSILADLADKLITHTPETKATELIATMQIAQNHTEASASVLAAVVKLIGTKLGVPEEGEAKDDYAEFDKKIDQLGTRARTARYVSDKVIKELDRLRSQSMCLGEDIWPSIEEVEHTAKAIHDKISSLCHAISRQLNPVEAEGQLSYQTLLSLLSSFGNEGSHNNDDFQELMTSLTGLQNKIDNVLTRTSDLSMAVEFEKAAAPWTIRAKDLKSLSQNTIPASAQEELANLQRRNTEISSRLSDRERTIEEMTIRVELAEKREQRMKLNQSQDQAYKDQIEALQAEKGAAASALSALEGEKTALQTQLQTSTQELELLRQSANADIIKETAAIGNAGTVVVNESTTKYLQTHLKTLQSEIASLQALAQHLREENSQLKIPVSEVRYQVARDSWLDPGLLARRKTRTPAALHQRALRQEAEDIYDNLIDVVKNIKPVRLQNGLAPGPAPQSTNDGDKNILPSSWQAKSETTRYKVLKQREEIERWDSWRDDLAKRAKLATRKLPAHRDSSTKTKRLPALPQLPFLPVGDCDKVPANGGPEIMIVES